MQPTNATYGGCSLAFEKQPERASTEMGVLDKGEIQHIQCLGPRERVWEAVK